MNEDKKPSKGPSAVFAEAAAIPVAGATPLAALLSTHLLRDGEIVQLVIKPSLWLIPFISLWFSAIVLLAAAFCSLLDHRIMHERIYFEIAAILIGSRLLVAIAQWMGRLYVLTDWRVMSISGVYYLDIFDCPLRKIARTRLVSPAREKLVLVGSIEIIPSDQQMPSSVWQTISSPQEVHQQIIAAINRARQTGHVE